MRHAPRGRSRQRVDLLRPQSLQGGRLPFAEIRSAECVSQAPEAVEAPAGAIRLRRGLHGRADPGCAGRSPPAPGGPPRLPLRCVEGLHARHAGGPGGVSPDLQPVARGRRRHRPDRDHHLALVRGDPRPGGPPLRGQGPGGDRPDKAVREADFREGPARARTIIPSPGGGRRRSAPRTEGPANHSSTRSRSARPGPGWSGDPADRGGDDPAGPRAGDPGGPGGARPGRVGQRAGSAPDRGHSADGHAPVRDAGSGPRGDPGPRAGLQPDPRGHGPGRRPRGARRSRSAPRRRSRSRRRSRR
ncbi:MAG: hypothetical protein JWN86_4333 [Planctomycetota bacterium]|nr:hypothetical protein [Planctomycetota bacterium]